jgi:uncharacterized tellurite resistance protein B-like protein
MTTDHATAMTHDEVAETIRGCLDALAAMEPGTVVKLEALAFVLARVADADHVLRDAERRRMEEILRERADLPPEHAVLVVEMARQRRRTADCGRSYRFTRDLRLKADPEQRRDLVSALVAVAAADGSICDPERELIHQLARELGLDRDQVDQLLASAR